MVVDGEELEEWRRAAKARRGWRDWKEIKFYVNGHPLDAVREITWGIRIAEV